MPNIYTFVDTTGLLSEVFESDLNFSGNWRSSANYYRYDVVDYGVARYVCTTANTNTAPPVDLQFTAYWSLIAFTSTGTGSSGTNSGGGVDNTQMVQDVYSLAYRAYNIALTGTDLPTPGSLDPWVMQWIGHTYNIARAGTNAANSADMWARDAYHLAVAGTNAANSADRWARDAYSLAVDGTNAAHSADSWGRDAFSIAVTGTNAANQAYSIALQALYAAWDGTNSSNFPAWVLDWLGQTYNLAVAGTNAANAVDTTARIALNTAWAGTDAAHSADSWGRDAFSIAVAGTNAADQAWAYAGQAWSIAVAGTNAANQAYSLALQALYTAWTGTDTPTPGPGGGSGTVPGWVMDWLGQTYNLSVAGTNAANSADSWGRDAFSLAVVGTNAAAAAQLTATTALNLANTLSTIANYGHPGTLTAFVGQVPGWKTDIELTIHDGVVTDVGNSRYSIEQFVNYNIGPIGTIAGDLGGGDRWDGTGRIMSSSYPPPAVSDITSSRSEGLTGGAMVMFVANDGTYGQDLVLDYGTGWDSPWIVNVTGYRIAGTESFESFSTGVVYGTNFTAAIGYGWSGTVGFY